MLEVASLVSDNTHVCLEEECGTAGSRKRLLRKREGLHGQDGLRPAMDMRAYVGDEARGEEAMVTDWVSYVREGSTLSQVPVEQRIFPYTWKIVENEDGRKVICPEFDENEIVTQFRWDGRKERIESHAQLKMRRWLLDQTEPFGAVWISPATEEFRYVESRLVMMFGDGSGQAEMLGIRTALDQKTAVSLARKISGLAESTRKELHTNLDVRSTPLMISGTRTEILERLESCDEHRWLKEYWPVLRNGTFKESLARDVQEARVLVRKLRTKLETVDDDDEESLLELGAEGERWYAQRGRDVRQSLVCDGISNTMALKGDGVALGGTGNLLVAGEMGIEEQSFAHIPMGELAGFMQVEIPKPVKECPHCKTPYNCVLPKYFVCKGTMKQKDGTIKVCDEMYLGC